MCSREHRRKQVRAVETPTEQLYSALFYMTEILCEKIPIAEVFENRNAVLQLKSNTASP